MKYKCKMLPVEKTKLIALDRRDKRESLFQPAWAAISRIVQNRWHEI